MGDKGGISDIQLRCFKNFRLRRQGSFISVDFAWDAGKMRAFVYACFRGGFLLELRSASNCMYNKYNDETIQLPFVPSTVAQACRCLHISPSFRRNSQTSFQSGSLQSRRSDKRLLSPDTRSARHTSCTIHGESTID